MAEETTYKMAKYMDRLPTVISCCFCCFLRAGSVLIAVVSFFTGMVLAPNISYAHGFWDFGVINTSNSPLENVAQLMIGIAGIWLCIISGCLLTGSLCNLPKLIECYQWGTIVYCGWTVLVYLVLAFYCFIVSGNCLVAGLTLLGLIFVNVLLTAYFIIVTNSLRMSMQYLNSSGIIDA